VQHERTLTHVWNATRGHNRAPPVVSLGEVPGVALSGLLGPSFRAPTKPIESTIFPLLSPRPVSRFLYLSLSLSLSLPVVSARDTFQLHIRRIAPQIPRITDFREISLLFRRCNLIYCCRLLLRVNFANLFTLIIFDCIVVRDSNVTCASHNLIIFIYICLLFISL